MIKPIKICADEPGATNTRPPVRNALWIKIIPSKYPLRIKKQQQKKQSNKKKTKSKKKTSQKIIQTQHCIYHKQQQQKTSQQQQQHLQNFGSYAM